MKNTIKEMELATAVDYKKKKALDQKLNEMNRTFQSVLNHRNILSKSLHSANVIYAILLFKTY